MRRDRIPSSFRDKRRSCSLGGTITGGSFDLCMQEHWRGGSKAPEHSGSKSPESERRDHYQRATEAQITAHVGRSICFLLPGSKGDCIEMSLVLIFIVMLSIWKRIALYRSEHQLLLSSKQ